MPGDEAEGALDQVDDDGAAGDVGIVDELVELEARAGPERQRGVVAQLDLADAVGADLDQLVLAHAVAGGEMALVLLVGRGDEVDDAHGGADVIAGRGHSRRDARHERGADQGLKCKAHGADLPPSNLFF